MGDTPTPSLFEIPWIDFESLDRSWFQLRSLSLASSMSIRFHLDSFGLHCNGLHLFASLLIHSNPSRAYARNDFLVGLPPASEVRHDGTIKRCTETLCLPEGSQSFAIVNWTPSPKQGSCPKWPSTQIDKAHPYDKQHCECKHIISHVVRHAIHRQRI